MVLGVGIMIRMSLNTTQSLHVHRYRKNGRVVCKGASPSRNLKFNHARNRKVWGCSVVEGTWDVKNSGGSLNMRTWVCNQQYLLQLADKAPNYSHRDMLETVRNC